ncbi:MAG: alpha/beta hydrolase [Leptolyngbya sp. SIO4C1]|nr:alpha/beta hydrolase [Leptolyngbya sp. SIO4C1]
MLFVTNRVLQQGPTPATIEGYDLPRSVSFDLENNQAEQSVYFCDRAGPGDYTEIGSAAFFEALKSASVDQILLYLHGYSSLPEGAIFPRAEELQRLLRVMQANAEAAGQPAQRVLVVPLIWPCDNDLGMVQDYFDDQKAADASDFAYMRLFEKFMHWRSHSNTVGDLTTLATTDLCTKRINILAHSMGNRVMRGAFARTVQYYRPLGLPLLFRNIFMVAADLVNETLAYGNPGEYIAQSARNVLVYYAADDLALRASKVANTRNGTTSRRLGHTGPEKLDQVANNVYAIDCDDFNTRYDSPTGHGYFTENPDTGDPGLLLRHIWYAINTGRLPGIPPRQQTQILNERTQFA